MKATANAGRTCNAAFQRRTLDVGNPTYNPSSTRRRGAGVRDGPTNEFVDMLTYQVLIQTLQLSEKSGTQSKISQEGLKTRSFCWCGVKCDKSLLLPPKQTAASLCHERLYTTSRRRAPFFRTWAHPKYVFDTSGTFAPFSEQF